MCLYVLESVNIYVDTFVYMCIFIVYEYTQHKKPLVLTVTAI